MSRDSILDEAEQKTEQAADDDVADTESEQDQGADSSDDRARLTQRVPKDLLEDIDKVKERFHFSSRNETINFMLSNAADDFLDERDG